MPAGIKFNIDDLDIEILSEYRGVESTPWDKGNHPAFDIYIRAESHEFAKFDFYGSLNDFNEGKDELSDSDLCSVAQMIMGDAVSGSLDFEEFKNNIGASKASNELQSAFEALKNQIEEGIGYIENSVGVNFEENKFDDSMSSVVDGWYPMMNSAWRLDKLPSESEVKELILNAPNASIVKIGDEHYITMNGGGTDLSQDIAYAYLKIDGDIPKELGVCRTQHLSASKKAFDEVVKYLNTRDMKEIAARAPHGTSLEDTMRSLNKGKVPTTELK